MGAFSTMSTIILLFMDKSVVLNEQILRTALETLREWFEQNLVWPTQQGIYHLQMYLIEILMYLWRARSTEITSIFGLASLFTGSWT